jgi:hypothetical protein
MSVFPDSAGCHVDSSPEMGFNSHDRVPHGAFRRRGAVVERRGGAASLTRTRVSPQDTRHPDRKGCQRERVAHAPEAPPRRSISFSELENGTGGPSAHQTTRAAERWLKQTNRQLAPRPALPLQDGRSHMGLTRNSPCSASLWDERGQRCRRAAISARSTGGPLRPGPALPSFSAGSCCLASPGGRKGACARALRG